MSLLHVQFRARPAVRVRMFFKPPSLQTRGPVGAIVLSFTHLLSGAVNQLVFSLIRHSVLAGTLIPVLCGFVVNAAGVDKALGIVMPRKRVALATTTTSDLDSNSSRTCHICIRQNKKIY